MVSSLILLTTNKKKLTQKQIGDKIQSFNVNDLKYFQNLDSYLILKLARILKLRLILWLSKLAFSYDWRLVLLSVYKVALRLVIKTVRGTINYQKQPIKTRFFGTQEVIVPFKRLKEWYCPPPKGTNDVMRES